MLFFFLEGGRERRGEREEREEGKRRAEREKKTKLPSLAGKLFALLERDNQWAPSPFLSFNFHRHRAGAAAHCCLQQRAGGTEREQRGSGGGGEREGIAS